VKEYGLYPTPLQPMDRLRGALSARPRLWIKRDDLVGPGFGGNKVRKLEFYLAKAEAEGCDCVVTTGAETSNHCRITAALAAQVGLECHLVLNPSAQSGTPASLFLDELYGAVIHRVRSREERAPRLAEVTQELRLAGCRPVSIPLGASTPLGALGFVQAAGELLSQCPQTGAIVHATSSGGTQAGLVAGLKLLGNETARVIGVSADDPAPEISETVRSIVAGIEILLDKPACSLQGPIEVDDRFTGTGYGIPSPEGDEGTRLLARTEGIVLDPVYTAKAFAGFLVLVQSGDLDDCDHVVFWHTGGQLALFHALRD
jgi:1-aminocyclopropane-1-carboxylate deaminase/D-cysteine desulfhydrase-like pyridoxal-dependent ACC family enzyme